MKYGIFIALAAVLGSGPALSAASEWETVEGAAVRVVLSASPDSEGRIRGALQIELRPGWKTYWLDPGDAGVPPSVAASLRGEPVQTTIGFPPPQRHEDGYGVWAGYDYPVSFALTTAALDPAVGPMEFSIFLGVCQTICIPVQATFSVEPENVASAEHEGIVESAFAALPEEPRPGLRVVAARVEGEELAVEAEAPTGASAELFLASTENRTFGTPVQAEGGHAGFRVPVLSGLSEISEETRYTLISGGRAVSGTVAIGK